MVNQVAEILTEDNPNRFVIFPIKYHNVWQFYKQSVSNFWSIEEIDVISDVNQWQKLNESECHYISVILAYLATGEDGIAKNIVQIFSQEIEIPEIRAFFGIQIAMENIHAEMYSLLLYTYIPDSQDREKLFRTIKSYKYFKEKDDWINQFIMSDKLAIGYRLIAYAIKKAIFFSGTFAAIKWMKRRQILPGMTLSNDLIYRDNSLHTDFAVLLAKYAVERPSNVWVHEIISQAVETEIEFINVTLPVIFIGLDCKKTSTFVKFSADEILNQLGYEKFYKIEKPFDFIERAPFKIVSKVENNHSSNQETFSIGDDF